MMHAVVSIIMGVAAGLLLTITARAYPVDGYDHTGIRRLEYSRAVVEGRHRGPLIPVGAQLGLDAVRPSGIGPARLPPPDETLSRRVAALLGDEADRYGVALIDLTDPDTPRYAAHNPHWKANVGSVGKLLVGMTLFNELARAHPDDIEERLAVLRETQVIADAFIRTDHHRVPMWDVDTEQFSHRPLGEGDRGSLWEYLDWMLSASSNAAASMVMQQVILLRRFGRDYPVSAARETRFFEANDRARLGELWLAAMEDAAAANGIDTDALRQGSLFTGEGKRRVAGVRSYGTPESLVKLLMRMERGELIDAFSSRALKRLLYMTQRRIRYASHPALHGAAVSFKSGSLYSCKPEPDFECGKYMGNRVNRLASVALIEAPAEDPRYRYAVVVMSNVLRKNSAVAHQTLAMRIHRLIERFHRELGTFAPDVGSAGGDDRIVGADETVEVDNHPLHPRTALRVAGKCDRDVTVPAMLDQRAVGVPAAPTSRFAVHPRRGRLAGQAPHELVIDGRLAKHGFHLPAEARRDQAAGFQQVVEACYLDRGSAMGNVVQRVAAPGGTLAVFLSNPQSTVVSRIVQAVARRAQGPGDVGRADPLHHGRGVAVRGMADHPCQGATGGGIELQVSLCRLLEGAQQDGDLRQARGVHHPVAVDRGHPGLARPGDVHQRDRELPPATCSGEPGPLQRGLELALKGRIPALAKFGVDIGRVAGECAEQQRGSSQHPLRGLTYLHPVFRSLAREWGGGFVSC